jgi:WD40 repeat protein
MMSAEPDPQTQDANSNKVASPKAANTKEEPDDLDAELEKLDDVDNVDGDGGPDKENAEGGEAGDGGGDEDAADYKAGRRKREREFRRKQREEKKRLKKEAKLAKKEAKKQEKERLRIENERMLDEERQRNAQEKERQLMAVEEAISWEAERRYRLYLSMIRQYREKKEADELKKIELKRRNEMEREEGFYFDHGSLQAKQTANDKEFTRFKTTPSVVTNFCGHEGAVYKVRFTQDESQMLTCSEDKTLKLWDVASGSLVMSLGGNGEGHTKVIRDCDIHPSYIPSNKDVGVRIAISCSMDMTIRFWCLDTKVEIHSLVGHADAITACSFSKNGDLVLSCSMDGTFRLWMASMTRPILSSKLAQVYVFKGHNGFLSHCTFSPTEKCIISWGGYGDSTIRLWNSKPIDIYSTPETTETVQFPVVESPALYLAPEESGSFFLPAKAFEEAKEGFVFKMGLEGLGYYLDRPIENYERMMAVYYLTKERAEDISATSLQPKKSKLGLLKIDKKWTAAILKDARNINLNNLKIRKEEKRKMAKHAKQKIKEIREQKKLQDKAKKQNFELELPGTKKEKPKKKAEALLTVDNVLKDWDNTEKEKMINFSLSKVAAKEYLDFKTAADNRPMMLQRLMRTKQLAKYFYTDYELNLATSKERKHSQLELPALQSRSERRSGFSILPGFESRKTERILKGMYESDNVADTNGLIRIMNHNPPKNEDGTIQSHDVFSALGDKGHKAWINNCKFSPCERRLASCASDGSIKV